MRCYFSINLTTLLFSQLNAEPHELLELGANGHEMKE